MLYSDDNYCIACSFNWLLQGYYLALAYVVLAFLICIVASFELRFENICIEKVMLRNEFIEMFWGKYVGKSE